MFGSGQTLGSVSNSFLLGFWVCFLSISENQTTFFAKSDQMSESRGSNVEKTKKLWRGETCACKKHSHTRPVLPRRKLAVSRPCGEPRIRRFTVSHPLNFERCSVAARERAGGACDGFVVEETLRLFFRVVSITRGVPSGSLRQLR